jgi:hypothetical protein
VNGAEARSNFEARYAFANVFGRSGLAASIAQNQMWSGAHDRAEIVAVGGARRKGPRAEKKWLVTQRLEYND